MRIGNKRRFLEGIAKIQSRLSSQEEVKIRDKGVIERVLGKGF